MNPIDRKPAFGVFAVICSATGDVWVDISQHVDSERDSLWSALRLGTSPHQLLQSVWATEGEESFRFEELERLRDDYPQIDVIDELIGRASLWKARLQARALT
ncbi:MAG: hypothetical protein CFE28_10620 [Alphaproteobacteria bacterium PA2]|nr:MAG: hypothetical protein CFE28_10620 [Alphaproteobacteria bacterium PA2]